MYLFSNILGVFVFDEKFSLVDEMPFNNLEGNKKKDAIIRQIQNKHKNLKEPDGEAIKKILFYFKNKKFFVDFCNKNLQLTKSYVKNSVGSDVLLMQSINLIGELDKAINLLARR